MRYGLLMLLIIGTLLVAARQPPPPPDLAPVTAVVRQLLPIEEQIEARNWAKARETARALAGRLKELPPFGAASAKPLLTTVNSRLQVLQAALAHGNAAASYQAYFDLRQGLFDLLSALGYPSSPTLLLARHDLEIARCAARQGQGEKEINHELDELEFNYRSALPALVESGVSQQQTADVLVKISQARDALETEERQALGDLLAELDQLLEQQQNGRAGE